MPEPYEGTCKTCKSIVAHKVQDVLTGYGHCTKHIAYQLKTPNDAAIIEGTPIVWHGCTCVLGELKE